MPISMFDCGGGLYLSLAHTFYHQSTAHKNEMRYAETMKTFTTYCALPFLFALTTTPALAEGGTGHTVDDESMAAMHESMSDLRDDMAQMRDASSNDIKLRMMEMHMGKMTRHMQMMMDAMEGQPVRRHDHRNKKN